MFNPMQGDIRGRLARALGEQRFRGICLFPAMHGVDRSRNLGPRRRERYGWRGMRWRGQTHRFGLRLRGCILAVLGTGSLLGHGVSNMLRTRQL